MLLEALMSNLHPFLERNRAFAATGAHAGLAIMPRQRRNGQNGCQLTAQSPMWERRPMGDSGPRWLRLSGLTIDRTV